MLYPVVSYSTIWETSGYFHTCQEWEFLISNIINYYTQILSILSVWMNEKFWIDPTTGIKYYLKIISVYI